MLMSQDLELPSKVVLSWFIMGVLHVVYDGDPGKFHAKLLSSPLHVVGKTS